MPLKQTFLANLKLIIATGKMPQKIHPLNNRVLVRISAITERINSCLQVNLKQVGRAFAARYELSVKAYSWFIFLI